MKRKAARLATAISSTAMLVVGAVALGAPAAHADAKKCSAEQHKEFGTSGFNTDVYITVCIERTNQNTGAIYTASANVRWGDGGGARKFDNFDVALRTERYDAVKSSKTWDFTDEINGTTTGYGSYIWTPAGGSQQSAGGWTGDGIVYYDLDADGNGGYSWDLGGSPQL